MNYCKEVETIEFLEMFKKNYEKGIPSPCGKYPCGPKCPFDSHICLNNNWDRKERYEKVCERLKELNMKKRTEFKVGDKVWDVGRGWGDIIAIDDDDVEFYPVDVRFSAEVIGYTLDGKLTTRDKYRSLFFKEIIIPEDALYTIEEDKEIVIAGKTIKLSAESYAELKKKLLED